MAAATAKRPTEWKFEATISFTATATSDSSSTKSPGSGSLDGSGADKTSPPPQVKVKTSHDPKAHNVGFSFVNVAHPNEAKGSSSKRAIRSHVARVQHSRVRISASVTKKTAKARTAARTLHPRPKPEIPREDSDEQIEEISREDHPPRFERHDSHSSQIFQDDKVYVPDTAMILAKARSPKEMETVLYRVLRDGRKDPFWSYPIPFHPFMERVIDHYARKLLADQISVVEDEQRSNLVHIAVDMDFLTPPGEKNILKRQWFPLCMTEPSIFYAITLMAASHFVFLNDHLKHMINILSLKQKTIEHINQALADPKRSRSDATLGAVMKMASYEAIFGDVKAYDSHMDGLQQLVQIRGGLPHLGLHGLLERVVLWIDSNASHQIGCAWKFDKKWFPTAVTHPPVDPAHFTRTSC